MCDYSILWNCIYLQRVKPVVFIYLDILQGNNFPKQYHALIRFSDRFITTPKFQFFSIKSTMMVTIFRHLRKSKLIVKVANYSIKSEAAIHGWTIKKLFWRLLKISLKKNLCMSFFLNKINYSLKRFFNKSFCTRVFLYALTNILEHLSLKTRSGDCFY